MTPTLLLRCGCEVRFVDGETPMCASHGPSSVVRTLHMPKPRFRGTATGPHVETVDLPPFVGVIVGQES